MLNALCLSVSTSSRLRLVRTANNYSRLLGVRLWVVWYNTMLIQGRLNSIGGPGQSNSLRPFLARSHTNFYGQTCRCRTRPTCILAIGVTSIFGPFRTQDVEWYRPYYPIQILNIIMP